MVWIHGGGFTFGDSSGYSAEYILERDVVLVVPQYRLGVLGFMSLEDPAMPGNYGLLDQVAALKQGLPTIN